MCKFNGFGVIGYIYQMHVVVRHSFEANVFAVGIGIVGLVNVVVVLVEVLFVFEVHVHDRTIVGLHMKDTPVLDVVVFLLLLLVRICHVINFS